MIKTHNVFIDLHTHTTASDGKFSPVEIYNQIKNISKDSNVIWSITDHDSVDAYLSLIKENILDDNVKMVLGCELSFNYNGANRDMLAYNIDLRKVKNFLESKYSNEFKIEKQKEILNKFKEICDKKCLKYDSNISIETGNKSEAYNKMMESVRKYPSNLKKVPEIGNNLFYRSHFSNTNSDFYISEVKNNPTLKEIIKIIHDCNGLAFVAHPFDYKEDINNINNYLNDCIEAGVDGIEVEHNSTNSNLIPHLKKIIKKNNLLSSGGSDFHGEPIKKNVKLFTGIDNNVNIKFNSISKWVKLHNINKIKF